MSTKTMLGFEHQVRDDVLHLSAIAANSQKVRKLDKVVYLLDFNQRTILL